jgi:hypothetical protein
VTFGFRSLFIEYDNPAAATRAMSKVHNTKYRAAIVSVIPAKEAPLFPRCDWEPFGISSLTQSRQQQNQNQNLLTELFEAPAATTATPRDEQPTTRREYPSSSSSGRGGEQPRRDDPRREAELRNSREPDFRGSREGSRDPTIREDGRTRMSPSKQPQPASPHRREDPRRRSPREEYPPTGGRDSSRREADLRNSIEPSSRRDVDLRDELRREREQRNPEKSPREREQQRDQRPRGDGSLGNNNSHHQQHTHGHGTTATAPPTARAHVEEKERTIHLVGFPKGFSLKTVQALCERYGSVSRVRPQGG